ncbi:PAP/fibrillin family protein [Synechococcus sp. WC101]|uniref:PAP/fibrillin family protein n=1 Tax=Synechococcus sp. WC101 TaxID=2964536 RepID=UPI0039C40537
MPGQGHFRALGARIPGLDELRDREFSLSARAGSQTDPGGADRRSPPRAKGLAGYHLSYLDEDLRIGRGSEGSVFVLQRVSRGCG